MKKLILIIVAAASFMIGYGADVKAWPIYGRNQYIGYFNSKDDAWGTHVLPVLYDSGTNAIPNYINSATELINFVTNDYYNTTGQEKVGAAFIMDTMTGGNHVWPLTSADVDDWESRVRFAADNNWIGWNTSFSYSYNSYFQGVNNGGPGGQLNPSDDAFYTDPDTATTITFKTSATGSWVYGIRRQCANPVGNNNFGALYNNNWTISARSTVSDSTPAPGQSIIFHHYIKNAGPNTTDPTQISWGTYSNVLLSSGTWGNIGSGSEVNVNNETYPVPANAANGTTICRHVNGAPLSDDALSSTAVGATVCATVTLNYDLHPTVSVNQTTAQDGDVVTFTYAVDNTGTTPSAPAQCTASGGSPSLTCSSSQVFPASSPPLTVGTENVTITTQTPGTTICRSLTITPASLSVGSRTSSSTCVVVAKTPYARFGGNDVWAGGGYATYTPSCNMSAKITTSGRPLAGTTSYAGSSVEYDAFALDKISSFGSAGRVLVGSGTLGSSARSLTFGNNESDVTKLGYYGASSHCLTDYASLFTPTVALANGSTVDVGTKSSGVYHVTGHVTIHGTMPAGSTQVYLVDSYADIDADLKYPSSYANLSAIPSLVLITVNENIRVNASVGQIDGFFVSEGAGVDDTGVFRTCWPEPTPQAVGDACDSKQLVINGAVAAAKLDLFRSYGASGSTITQRQTPAELFNFTPELYLRNALSNSKNPLVQVVNSFELPPRF